MHRVGNRGKVFEAGQNVLLKFKIGQILGANGRGEFWIEERFLRSAGRRVRSEANAKKRRRLAPFGMTVGGLGERLAGAGRGGVDSLRSE